MYRFAADMEIEGLIGSGLNQICIGKYDVQFRFDSGTLIAVQGGARVLRNDEQVSAWTEENSWDSLEFHELLNLSVTNYTVLSEVLLRINFSDELSLELIDSSDQYESMQIYPKGLDGPMIVV